MDKTILLASFIYKEKLEWFINHLDTEFNIQKNRVFGYENPTDDNKIILTFKIAIKDGERLNLKESFPNAVIIHKRGNALYTINALNELIRIKFGDEIDTKSVKINWSDYQNKFILLDNKKLTLLNIKRVF